MSLTGEDLLQIRQIMTEVVDMRLEPIQGELIALDNDVKEIYDILSKNNIA